MLFNELYKKKISYIIDIIKICALLVFFEPRGFVCPIITRWGNTQAPNNKPNISKIDIFLNETWWALLVNMSLLNIEWN